MAFSGIASDYKQGGEGLELAGNHAIVRFNSIYNAKGAGIMPYDKGLGGDTPCCNYIYSNTIYHNGHELFGADWGGGPVRFSGIYIVHVFNNVIKNNIGYLESKRIQNTQMELFLKYYKDFS